MLPSANTASAFYTGDGVLSDGFDATTFRSTNAFEQNNAGGGQSSMSRNGRHKSCNLQQPGDCSRALLQTTELHLHSDVAEEKEILTINVSGLQFQTYRATLQRYPDTLLGNPSKLARFWNAARREYFMDRHRASFDAILYYYQSMGYLRRPVNVPIDVFLDEVVYFELGHVALESFWAHEGYVKPKPIVLPKNPWQSMVWQLVELADSSIGARVVAFTSIFVIIVSTVSFCLETLPVFNQAPLNVTNSSASQTRDEWGNPFFIIETVCIVWFTLEFVLRFASCPSKMTFCRSFLNWVDFLAIFPFFVNLIASHGNTATSFAVLRVIRLVRVFRIFKLSRHSRGLQILGLTFKTSVRELCLLVFFLCIALVLFSSAMYFAEQSEPNTKFPSIPDAFWFCIVTMSTVGYGDLVPTGGLGKFVGSLCAVVGVLVIALPVPVIVENFKHFYRQEHRLARMGVEDSLERNRTDSIDMIAD